ncbi:MAG: hypothetical protein HRU38_16655 [Saccharospirillaceae bacterium]|nr:hypothetical protein [Pseudomonadales bacterium]NRB80271.1 hypothetical protein [Saccharospirillaceae bacterium]
MKKLITISSIAILLSACENTDDNSNPDTNDNTDTQTTTHQSATINATSYDEAVFFSFEKNALVAESEDWDLKLKRASITGSAASSIALANTPAGYYDTDNKAIKSSFESADETQEALALATAYDLTTLNYINDELVYAIDNSWYNYNHGTHAITAQPQNWFIVANDDYSDFAKMHTKSYDSTSKTFTFELFTQLSAESTFSTTPVTFDVSFSDQDVCFSLSNQTTVDCDTQEYDIHAITTAHSIDLKLAGGTYHLALDQAAVDAITSTTDISENAGDLYHYFRSDAVKGALSENSWYAYGLNGGHVLWPNFRTYVIDTDTTDDTSAQYTFQIANYYDGATGTSAVIKINFEAVQ